jgi:hypothetical protein
MASKRLIRRRQCGDKVAHQTKADALRLVNVLWRKDGGRMNAYRCPWCHKWHVGHKPLRGRHRGW